MRNINRYFPWVKFVMAGFLVAAIFSLMAWLAPITKEKPEVVAPEGVKVSGFAELKRVPNFEGKKLVALTYDDGPYEATTSRLLDILHDKQVKATFFELGNMILRYPEVTKRAAAEGHEVESHSVGHANLSKMSKDEVGADVSRMEEIFDEVLGRKPKFLRPPYGAVAGAVKEAPIYLMGWTVDSLDWKSRNTEAIVSEVRADVFDGAVVLMHDIYDTTVEASEKIIDELKAEDYEFVTVEEMFEAKEVEPKYGVLQGKF